jgi:hypothetical protein
MSGEIWQCGDGGYPAGLMENQALVGKRVDYPSNLMQLITSNSTQ